MSSTEINPIYMVNLVVAREPLKEFFREVILDQSSIDEVFPSPGDRNRDSYLPKIEALLFDIGKARRGLYDFPKVQPLKVEKAYWLEDLIGEPYAFQIKSAKIVETLETALAKYIKERSDKGQEIDDFTLELRILNKIRVHEEKRDGRIQGFLVKVNPTGSEYTFQSFSFTY